MNFVNFNLNRIVLILMPILAYALLIFNILFANSGSFWQLIVGMLHGAFLFAPELLNENELRHHYIFILIVTVITSSLVFLLGSWMLVIWLCLLAGISFSAVISSTTTWDRLTETFLVMLHLLLIYFFVVPHLLNLTNNSDWIELTNVIYICFFAWLATYLLSLHSYETRSNEPIISLLFFLLLVILVLCVTLSYLLVPQYHYYQIVLIVLFSALIISSVSWILWSPNIGGGLSTVFFRHILSLSIPFDEWMKDMTKLANNSDDANKFWDEAMTELLHKTNLIGISWGEGEDSKLIGEDEGKLTHLPLSHSSLYLYSMRQIPPSRLFNLWLLARVALEFKQSKEREIRLTAEATMRSVHEIGARTTHDIKNILHAINLLCKPQPGEKVEFTPKKMEQLLALGDRLENSLSQLKGRSLALANEGMMPAKQWWEIVTKRNSSNTVKFICNIDFNTSKFDIPVDLFDRTLENLLHNALRKQSKEGDMKIEIELANGPSLIIRDNGSVIPPEIENKIFNSPLPSKEGMGIGLFQLALNAKKNNYQIFVEANSPGEVAFKLEKNHK